MRVSATAFAALGTRRGVLQGIFLAALLAAGFALLAAPDYRFTGDTEHYVALARNIATGGPYQINGQPEVKFPPGFPLLLAPAAALARGSFAAISRWAAILASGVGLLTWLYLRRRQPGAALPVAVLTVGSIPFLSLATGNPMSEPAYLALSLALLLWADSWYAGEPAWRSWGTVVLGSLLLMGLPAVRTIGVAGVVAAGLMLGVEPRGRRLRLRDALPFAAGTGFVVAWLWWTTRHPVARYTLGDGGYLHDLLLVNPHHPDLGRASIPQVMRRIAENFTIQAAHAGELLTPISWVKPGWDSPALIAVPVLLAGWWQELRGAGRFGALYFLCYMGILLLWPYDEGARFLLPVAPLLWLYLLIGLHQLHGAIRMHPGRVRVTGIAWSAAAAILLAIALPVTPLEYSRQFAATFGLWTLLFLTCTLGWGIVVRLAHGWTPRKGRVLAGAAVPLFLLASLVQVGPLLLQRARGVPDSGENARALREAARWISANTSERAVIQTTYTTRLNFATGRRAVPFPTTRDPDPFLEIQRRFHPGYLVVLDSDDGFYVPSDRARFLVLDALFPYRWRLAHRFEGGTIYAFR